MELEHNELVRMLDEIGKMAGFESRREYGVGDENGKIGRIDVVWKKDGEIITIEIEDTAQKEQQLKNFLKCMRISNKHIHIFATPPRIQEVLDQMKDDKKLKIVVLNPAIHKKYSRISGILTTKIKDGTIKEITESYVNETSEEWAKKFMEEMDCSRATAFRHLNRLKQDGLIKTRERRGVPKYQGGKN